MANFKVAKKDALSDTRTNIYNLHEKKLEYFESEKKKLNSYQSQLVSLKENKVTLDKKYILNKSIEELENKINNIIDDTELNNYLLEFISIINEYQNENSLFEESLQKGIMDTFVNASINTTKSELYNDYIKKFNPELKSININKNEKKVCMNCQSDKFFYEAKTCCEICNNCGNTNSLLFAEENAPVYTENLEQIAIFNYKRNNHFQECLNQLQAKENTTIPPIIIQRLAAEFKKYNITNPKLFTPSLVKVYLRKLEYNKYYEHIPTIINEFCGLPAPELTSELEQQLKIMFDEIQVILKKLF